MSVIEHRIDVGIPTSVIGCRIDVGFMSDSDVGPTFFRLFYHGQNRVDPTSEIRHRADAGADVDPTSVRRFTAGWETSR